MGNKQKWIKEIGLSLSTIKSDPVKLELFKSLLSAGYFPYQLPPPFNTHLFYDFLTSNLEDFFTEIKKELISDKGIKTAKSSVYYLARPAQLRRTLHIAPPLQYSLLCLEIAAQWDTLGTKATGTGKAISIPVIAEKDSNTPDRAISFKNKWQDLPRKKLKERSQARYAVQADIARFFPSIYTHSIPWAIEGKKLAKKNRAGHASVGNRLDSYTRAMQDGQTLGIPIGPDTSHLISEIILANIDTSIQTSHLGFVRVVDDYELYCSTLSTAEKCLITLQEELKKYELELNSLKTKIEKLPIFLEQDEINKLRAFNLEKDINTKSLITYFDLAFNAYKNNNKSGSLKYALRRFEQNQESPITLEGESLTCLIDFMCQCILIEPGTVEYVLRIISQYGTEVISSEKEKISACLEQLLEEHIKLKHSSEISWALWGYIILHVNIPQKLAQEVANSGDIISTILLLDAHKRKLIKRVTLKDIFQDFEEETLFGSRWLLAYESIYQKWAPAAKRTILSKSPAFNLMKEKGVNFYNAPQNEPDYIELMATWKPVTGYGDEGEDDDLDDEDIFVDLSVDEEPEIDEDELKRLTEKDPWD